MLWRGKKEKKKTRVRATTGLRNVDPLNYIRLWCMHEITIRATRLSKIQCSGNSSGQCSNVVVHV